jgi:hypothetical protein
MTGIRIADYPCSRIWIAATAAKANKMTSGSWLSTVITGAVCGTRRPARALRTRTG